MPPKDRLGLPVRPFLYTLDQIASLIAMDLKLFKRTHLYFDGRSVGPKKKGQMLARNIAVEGETPDWRVTEQELIRWLRFAGFRVYDRTSITV